MLEMTWPLAITKAGTPVAAMAEHMAYLQMMDIDVCLSS